MTVVNNLCFNADQFLKLLEVTEIGERVYFVDLSRLDNLMIWVGSTMPGYKIIRSVKDEPERLEILEGFCPFFSGKI